MNSISLTYKSARKMTLGARGLTRFKTTVMENKLILSNKVNISDTFFRDYFYQDGADTIPELSYEEIVELLGQLGCQNGQDIFAQADGDGKTSFNLFGMFRGEAFCLYDWKDDNCIHIGGTEKLDIDKLKTCLLLAIGMKALFTRTSVN